MYIAHLYMYMNLLLPGGRSTGGKGQDVLPIQRVTSLGQGGGGQAFFL